ncbi:RING/U-box superfamily protein [Raphanus sativus]|nr:RING/U-box superfamily protein [Raphanus sativus]
MSALKSRSNSLAGLTLDAVLGGEIVIQPSSPPSPPQNAIVPQRTTTTPSQTLFDIIRYEYEKEEHKDRTTWQIFREKLRLKRTGSAWTSSFHIPASDILIPNPKHIAAEFRSQSNELVHAIPMSDPPGSSGRGMFTRGSSMRVGSGKNPESNFADVSIPGDGPPSSSFKPQLSRHDSVRDHGDGDDDKIRRHPVVKFVDERQMSAREAVKIKSATFTLCGHTFCKLCSKELMAQKGHCPVCTTFVLEFLEIF